MSRPSDLPSTPHPGFETVSAPAEGDIYFDFNWHIYMQYQQHRWVELERDPVEEELEEEFEEDYPSILIPRPSMKTYERNRNPKIFASQNITMGHRCMLVDVGFGDRLYLVNGCPTFRSGTFHIGRCYCPAKALRHITRGQRCSVRPPLKGMKF